ncbi:MAG: shikimate kinase [Bacteroidales bacterium]|jgi:shikimate kinase
MHLVFYIGFMGSGKTTLGARHAQEKNACFVDMDQVILDKTGISPRDILGLKGEKAFRKIERDTLHGIVRNWYDSGKPATIVACGGGTPCFHDNLDFMKTHGHVVFIDTPLEIILKRLSGEPERWPLLQNADATKLYNSRIEWYKKADERVVP